MGSLFGGLLAEKGLDVTLIDVWQEHVDAIKSKGLKMVGFGGDRYINVRASDNPAELSPVDVVFVQCKAAATAEAIKNAKPIIDEALKVAQAEGLDIGQDESREVLLKIIASNQTNKSSLCVDILNKRKTEILHIKNSMLKYANLQMH